MNRGRSPRRWPNDRMIARRRRPYTGGSGSGWIADSRQMSGGQELLPRAACNTRAGRSKGMEELEGSSDQRVAQRHQLQIDVGIDDCRSVDVDGHELIES